MALIIGDRVHSGSQNFKMRNQFSEWFEPVKLRIQHFFSQPRPPYEGFYVFALAVVLGFMVADMGILWLRPAMLPSEAPPKRPAKIRTARVTSVDYSRVVERNMFHIGDIPPALGASGEGGSMDGPPVKSSLPLTLLGTLVHLDPLRSVASIQINSSQLTAAVKVDDQMEDLILVKSIERQRVVFQNLNNRRPEYIEIAEDNKLAFDVRASGPKAGEIAKASETDFTLSRATVDVYLNDLSGVLRQARMVPNIIPGSGGMVEGFRFQTIEPGSIYEKLGFQPNDVLKSANGEAVNSPAKALEMFNMLKTSPQIKITVERNGREEEFNYNIQ
jgi:general secretion pathway protein C